MADLLAASPQPSPPAMGGIRPRRPRPRRRVGGSDRLEQRALLSAVAAEVAAAADPAPPPSLLDVSEAGRDDAVSSPAVSPPAVSPPAVSPPAVSPLALDAETRRVPSEVGPTAVGLARAVPGPGVVGLTLGRAAGTPAAVRAAEAAGGDANGLWDAGHGLLDRLLGGRAEPVAETLSAAAGGVAPAVARAAAPSGAGAGTVVTLPGDALLVDPAAPVPRVDGREPAAGDTGESEGRSPSRLGPENRPAAPAAVPTSPASPVAARADAAVDFAPTSAATEPTFAAPAAQPRPTLLPARALAAAFLPTAALPDPPADSVEDGPARPSPARAADGASPVVPTGPAAPPTPEGGPASGSIEQTPADAAGEAAGTEPGLAAGLRAAEVALAAAVALGRGEFRRRGRRLRRLLARLLPGRRPGPTG